MKKLILTGIATLGLALGAFAQGGIFMDNNYEGGYISIDTPNNYYTGTATFQVWAYNSSTLQALDPVNYMAQLQAGNGWHLENTASVSVNGGLFSYPSFVTLSDVTGGNNVNIAIVASTADHQGLASFVNPTGNLGKVPADMSVYLTGWTSAGAQDLVMVQTIPEPSTIALGVMGLSTLLFRRRK